MKKRKKLNFENSEFFGRMLIRLRIREMGHLMKRLHLPLIIGQMLLQITGQMPLPIEAPQFQIVLNPKIDMDMPKTLTSEANSKSSTSKRTKVASPTM